MIVSLYHFFPVSKLSLVRTTSKEHPFTKKRRSAFYPLAKSMTPIRGPLGVLDCRRLIPQNFHFQGDVLQINLQLVKKDDLMSAGITFRPLMRAAAYDSRN